MKPTGWDFKKRLGFFGITGAMGLWTLGFAIWFILVI